MDENNNQNNNSSTNGSSNTAVLNQPVSSVVQGAGTSTKELLKNLTGKTAQGDIAKIKRDIGQQERLATIIRESLAAGKVAPQQAVAQLGKVQEKIEALVHVQTTLETQLAEEESVKNGEKAKDDEIEKTKLEAEQKETQKKHGEKNKHIETPHTHPQESEKDKDNTTKEPDKPGGKNAGAAEFSASTNLIRTVEASSPLKTNQALNPAAPATPIAKSPAFTSAIHITDKKLNNYWEESKKTVTSQIGKAREAQIAAKNQKNKKQDIDIPPATTEQVQKNTPNNASLKPAVVNDQTLMYTKQGFVKNTGGHSHTTERKFAKNATRQLQFSPSQKKVVKDIFKPKIKRRFLGLISAIWLQKLKTTPKTISHKNTQKLHSDEHTNRKRVVHYQRLWNTAFSLKNLWNVFKKPALKNIMQDQKYTGINKQNIPPKIIAMQKLIQWRTTRDVKHSHLTPYSTLNKHAPPRLITPRQPLSRSVLSQVFATRNTGKSGFFSTGFTTVNNRLGQVLGRARSRPTARTLKKSSPAKKVLKTVKAIRTLSFLANPIIWPFIGGIVLLLLFCLVMIIVVTVILDHGNSGGGPSSGGGDSPGVNPPGVNPPGGNPGQQKSEIPGFTLTKTVDKAQANYPDDKIKYTITYSYSPPSGSSIQLSDITVFDAIPTNSTLVSTNGSLDTTTNTVTWDLANVTSLELIVKPTADKTTISNQAYALAKNNGTQGGAGPTASDCNGVYAAYLAEHGSPHANYGDPNCTLADAGDPAIRNNMIAEALKAQDPKNVDFWLNILIPCESSYIPIAYNGNSTSGTGAYGLFQVNQKGQSTSGEFDVGNVDWPQQVVNGTSLAKSQGGSLAYWDTRCTQGKESLQY